MSDKDETIAQLRGLLLESKRKHYLADWDHWYSCPKAEGGCGDPQWDKDECNCGADDWNAKVDAALVGIDG